MLVERLERHADVGFGVKGSVSVHVLRDTLHQLSTAQRYSGNRRDPLAYMLHLEAHNDEGSDFVDQDRDTADGILFKLNT